VQNRDDEAGLRAIGALRPGQAVLVRGSAVDLEVFRATPLPGGVFLVVLTARMLWDKGVGELVQAAEHLRARGVTVRMALVGPHDPENPAAAPLAQLETWRERGSVEWRGTGTTCLRCCVAHSWWFYPRIIGKGFRSG
jgi:hypothetical protein